MKVRRLIASDFARAFTQCDLIASPVTPASPSASVKRADPVAMYLRICTRTRFARRIPTMSIPCGFGQGKKNGKRPVDCS